MVCGMLEHGAKYELTRQVYAVQLHAGREWVRFLEAGTQVRIRTRESWEDYAGLLQKDRLNPYFYEITLSDAAARYRVQASELEEAVKKPESQSLRGRAEVTLKKKA